MLPRLNDQNFDAAIRSPRPIFVTFTAPKRCPRCVEQKPDLEALARLGVPVYLVDVEQPDSANIEAMLGGRGVPFHKVFVDGLQVFEKLGKTDLESLKGIYAEGAKIARHIAEHGLSAMGSEPFQDVGRAREALNDKTKEWVF